MIALLVALLLQIPAAGASKHPVEFDRTGVAWVRSFKAARAKAKAEKRLLFIMPDTWQPTDDGATGIEGFRAFVLSDARVRRLLNRRFVCYYCNVFGGAAYDPAAKKFVTRVKSVFGRANMSFFGGSPLLFMTPGGKLVKEVKSSARPDEVLAAMTKVLKKNHKYAARSRAEKAEKDRLAQARLRLDLLDYKGATRLLKKLLEGEQAQDALLLLARIARETHDTRKLAAYAARLTDKAPGGRAAVERAWALWFGREFDQLAEVLSRVPKDSPHYDEARYLLGIALHQLGKTDDALGVWRALVKGREQSPWVYRADWVYSTVMRDPKRWGGKAPPFTSLLGRRMYATWPPPDLEGPGRR